MNPKTSAQTFSPSASLLKLLFTQAPVASDILKGLLFQSSFNNWLKFYWFEMKLLRLLKLFVLENDTPWHGKIYIFRTLRWYEFSAGFELAFENFLWVIVSAFRSFWSWSLHHWHRLRVRGFEPDSLSVWSIYGLESEGTPGTVGSLRGWTWKSPCWWNPGVETPECCWRKLRTSQVTVVQLPSVEGKLRC